MIRRKTPAKEAIMNVLANSSKAMSWDAIGQKIAVEVDKATIYRVLSQFCQDGSVHKFVADDGKQYFAICQKCDQNSLPENHFHFRCIKCQTVECLAAEVKFSLPKDYEVVNVNCVLVGTCADCMKAKV